jgi:hypothetical protein
MVPAPARRSAVLRWLAIVGAVIVVVVFLAWLLTADDLNGLLGAGS